MHSVAAKSGLVLTLWAAGLGLAQTAGAQTEQAPGDPVLIGLMDEYCREPDRNPYWCASEGRARTLPDAQRFDILRTHCLSGTAPGLCAKVKEVREPLTLEYHFRSGLWDRGRFEAVGEPGGRARYEEDAVTGKPAIYVKHGERVSVIVNEINPMAYGLTRGEPTVRDIEGIEAIKMALSTAGGVLSAVAAMVTPARALPLPSPPPPVTPAERSRDGVRVDALTARVDTRWKDAEAEALEITAAAARELKAPLTPVQRAVERLDMQHRRLARTMRLLDQGEVRLGRPFDTDIERADTWSALFETLRSAPDASGLNGCAAILDIYVAAVESEKAVGALGKLAEFTVLRDRPGCPFKLLNAVLSESAGKIQEAAAGPSGDLDATRREQAALALPAVRSVRQALAALTKARETALAVIEKEGDLRKQAALSQRLSHRAMNAALRTFGVENTTPVATACGASAAAAGAEATSWSLRRVSGSEDARVRVTMTPAGGGRTDIDVDVPGDATAIDIPIGVWDADLFTACTGVTAITGSTGGIDVVKHQGLSVYDRLYAREFRFGGRVTKVQTETLTLARLEGASADTSGIDTPKERAITYDVARRSGAVFGAGVGMIYTPVVSRTFSLVDPSPESTTTVKTSTTESGTTTETVFPESRVISETDSDARAGFLAAFLNLRLLQWLKPDTATWPIKPGLEVGFAMSTENPALLVGASFEVSRYVRAGIGRSWVSATDLTDRSLVGTTVPSGYTIQTDKRMRPSWYASLTLALDGLPIFSGGK